MDSFGHCIWSLEYRYNGYLVIIWGPNKAINIKQWSICGGGQLERFYCNWYLSLPSLVLGINKCMTRTSLESIRTLWLSEILGNGSAELFTRHPPPEGQQNKVTVSVDCHKSVFVLITLLLMLLGGNVPTSKYISSAAFWFGLLGWKVLPTSKVILRSVHRHALCDFIVLLHWETMEPAPWLDSPINNIVLTLSKPVFAPS